MPERRKKNGVSSENATTRKRCCSVRWRWKVRAGARFIPAESVYAVLRSSRRSTRTRSSTPRRRSPRCAASTTPRAPIPTPEGSTRHVRCHGSSTASSLWTATGRPRSATRSARHSRHATRMRRSTRLRRALRRLRGTHPVTARPHNSKRPGDLCHLLHATAAHAAPSNGNRPRAQLRRLHSRLALILSMGRLP
jgi:hypothetical protein